MIRQMSFQSKLVVTYSVFITVLMLFFGLIFYYYNSYNYEKNAYSNLNSLAKKISQQLDYCVQTMDYLSLDVISYEDLRNALGDLAYLDRDNPENMEAVSRSMQIIRGHTIRDSIIRTAHRMSVFNLKGDFFTSIANVDSNNPSLMQKITELSWLEKAKSKKGGKYLITSSKDVWAAENPIEVFSLVRVIKTPLNEVGFVEVQNSTDKLRQICSVNENIKVLVINDEGNIVYSNKTTDDASLHYYTSIPGRNDSDFFTSMNPVTKSAEIISTVSSGYTGWTVFVTQNRAALLQPLAFTRNLTFIIGLALTIITFVAFYFFSRQLTSPLRKLKEAMEEVSIENLPDQMNVRHENNEIKSLNKSFQHMRERLNEAIQFEIKSRSMHMRAHFDALQAQINPHFIFNMLNVLANMGCEAGVSEISDTCRRMAEMLRYSTSTENKRTTLKNEINHVENYLNLMKKRFEYKLEYWIDVDERLYGIIIPKIVLQPLVENSIYHGFNQSPGRMEIRVAGVLQEDKWQIDIIDNGSGFDENVLKDLESQIEHYARNLYSSEDAQGLSIGGMGIISTFARLSLYYGKELKFIIRNNDTQGACISIGGTINTFVQGEK